MFTVEGTQPDKQEGDVLVTFRVPKQSYLRLMELVRKVEAVGLDEVTKNAYCLFEAMVDEADAGATFFIKRKGDEVPVPYDVF